MRKAALIFLLSCACTETAQLIPPPEAVGLPPVRPYPEDGSPCYVIGENELTNKYLDDASLLVGCPRAMTPRIATLEAEGASIVAFVERWALISLPLR